MTLSQVMEILNTHTATYFVYLLRAQMWTYFISFFFFWWIVCRLKQGTETNFSPKITCVIWILSAHFYLVSSLGSIKLKFLLNCCYIKKWLIFSPFIFVSKLAHPSSHCGDSMRSAPQGPPFQKCQGQDIGSKEPSVHSPLPSPHGAARHHLRWKLLATTILSTLPNTFSLESSWDPHTFSDTRFCACLRWNDMVLSGRNLGGATDYLELWNFITGSKW